MFKLRLLNNIKLEIKEQKNIVTAQNVDVVRESVLEKPIMSLIDVNNKLGLMKPQHDAFYDTS